MQSECDTDTPYVTGQTLHKLHRCSRARYFLRKLCRMQASGVNRMSRTCQTAKCQTNQSNRHVVLPTSARLKRLRPNAMGPNIPEVTQHASSQDLWERLSTARRQMKQAVADEDFGLAARLRDDTKMLADQLPPVQQYLFHTVEKLKYGTAEERIQAVNALGSAGDDMVVAELAACLEDPSLQGPAADAMWNIFMRSKNPAINELMVEGMSKMRDQESEEALKVFDQMVKLDPTFAEGYNKRATVLYQLGRHADSIRDCESVLKMQPYHFGAASGMGLCYLAQKQNQQAMRCFDLALAIHPGLDQIKHYYEVLKQQERGGERST